MKKWGILLFVLAANLAHAHGVKLAVPDNQTWQRECGDCHLAYPPQLMTQEAWRRLMGRLDRHFGENAELDPRDARVIREFLLRYAADGARFDSSKLRVSDTPWFRHEHDEVPQRAWNSPAVRSPANCAACHVDAARGDWSERGLRMPAGLRSEGGRGEEDDDEDDEGDEEED